MDGQGNIEETARQWAKAQRKAGKSDEELRTEMLKKGYSASFINNLLKKRSKLFYIIPLAIIILIAAVYFLAPYIPGVISSISSKSCATQACFITAADSCSAVKMQQVEAGSLFSYSEKGCILTKTLKTMNETEPAEMKDLLEGKSLTCAYTSGDFNENWINTLSIGIENCSGELKDAIDELVYAV